MISVFCFIVQYNSLKTDLFFFLLPIQSLLNYQITFLLNLLLWTFFEYCNTRLHWHEKFVSVFIFIFRDFPKFDKAYGKWLTFMCAKMYIWSKQNKCLIILIWSLTIINYIQISLCKSIDLNNIWILFFYFSQVLT